MNVRRWAHAASVAALTMLIGLCVAWELWLAPLRPGGSWVVLKALPLLAPLPGVLRGYGYTFRWASMLALAYFVEGVVRAYAERGVAAMLASFEVALALIFIGAAIAYLRSARAGGAPSRPLTPAD